MNPLNRNDWILVFVLGLLLGENPVPAQPPDAGLPAKPSNEVIRRAVVKVKPALVRIHVVSVQYQGGREIKSESTGSGAIITPEGHIITNHHVAGHAIRLFCTLSDKREIEADLVGTDPLSDIAVIRLRPERGESSFPTVEFGDSDRVRVGDPVLAMGSPLALSPSVTLGIISNTEMVLPDFFRPFNRFLLDGEDVGSTVLWLGHDAEIHGGNSGGPLVNLEGEIIGINEIKLGLSGAIPGNYAREVAEELIERGNVQRAWLGLTIQKRLKFMEHEHGVLVTGALEGSPAERAGFRTGDILLRLGDSPVTVRFSEEIPRFNRLVADLPIGREIEAAVLRKGEKKKLKVTPVEREKVLPSPKEVKEWGLTVRNLSLVLARQMKREDRKGALVTSVRPGGPAGTAKPGLQSADVIVEVSGTPISTVEDLVQVTGKLLEGNRKTVPVLVFFERKKKQYLTTVNVGIRRLQDPGLEVKKAWLPVAIQVLTRDMAENLGIPKVKGVRVTQVYPLRSSADLDLKVGDIITAVDDEPLEVRDPADYEVFPTVIRQYKAGSEVTLDLIRNGVEKKVTVRLVRAPKLAREMKRYRDRRFEFTVRDIAFLDKASEGWDQNQQGVLVTDVVPGGWAAVADLSVGDLILEVNRSAVTDVDSLEKEMNSIVKQQPRSVVFLVLRGIHPVYVEMEPNW